MDKSIPRVNQKRSAAPEQPETKKKQHHQQPLKVVYITNPMKFKASASEFRALVQELTGQDSDASECAPWFSGEMEADGDVHAVDDEVIEAEHVMNCEVGRTGLDPSDFGSSLYEDVFYRPEMMDGFGSGLVGFHEAATHVDVYKNLDAV